MHPLRQEIRSLDRTPRALKSFGYVVGIALVLAAGAVLLFNGSTPVTLGLATAGVLLVAFGITAPRVLGPVHLAWMALAVLLGYVMTRVILTLVFYLLVTPIGLLMRLSGRDPMRRRLKPDAPSYWIPRKDTLPAKERLEKYY